ncbi:glycerophosphodiester phosphodiesterase domain-containing protein 4-like [Ovis canadensis]|uniref:glycerophosphodiester phosphodiesterase domain-containing protein 4-like n=1 Tax=Ovis canadensis TaxID=37174 RepID=UPI003751FC85
MDNTDETENEETGRWRNFNSWIKCNFNYECYMTFLNGCYSCNWEAKQEKKARRPLCCCSLRERLFYPWLIVSFCLSTVLLFTWIETSNEFNGFDWVVFLGTGVWFFWSIVLLSFLGILAAYTTLLLVLGFLLCWEKNQLYLHWYHKILILITILFCSLLLWILLTYWKDRWLTIGLSLQIFSPYIHLSSISVMILLSWPVAIYLIHLEGEARMRRFQITSIERKRNKRCNMHTKLRALQVAIGLPFVLILLCLCVVPFGIYSPCVQEKDKLGPKPNFFGHRGAPMLGPENTIMSFEKAVEYGAHGLESDVQISLDKVPFLMHDYDLRRTTNILDVMPNASHEHSSFFNWDFLSTLNAGKWFSDSWIKPFFRMKPLSEADKERARNQKIPKLSELLELAQKEKKLVIFDLNAPPQSHPSRSSYIRLVVSVILDSKIEQHLIIWLPGSDRKYVRSKAPGFQHIGRLFTIEELRKENITRINVDYKRLFYNGLKEYKAANITINLYIINEPWLFSLAWCSRIHSVTTDNIQVLKKINHPYYFMTPKFYLFMWIFMDILAAVFIVAIFHFYWKRESQSEKILHGITSYTETPSTSLHDEVLEVVEIPGLLTKSDSEVIISEVVNETTAPTVYPTDDVGQLVPTEPAFEPIQAPTSEANREATLQTVLLTLEANEPTVPFVEKPPPEMELGGHPSCSSENISKKINRAPRRTRPSTQTQNRDSSQETAVDRSLDKDKSCPAPGLSLPSQQLKVPSGDVEEGVAAAPVGELGEGASGQDVLGEQRESEVAHLDCLASLSSAPAQRHHPHEGPQALRQGKKQEGRVQLCHRAAVQGRPWLGPARGTAKQAQEAVRCVGPVLEF